MRVVLGIDVGTQSVQVLCLDTSIHQVVATAYAPVNLISRDDGVREQQANGVLVQQHDWCTDQFPADLYDAAHGMMVVLATGGFQPGGLDFDAKVRRESVFENSFQQERETKHGKNQNGYGWRWRRRLYRSGTPHRRSH